MAGRRPRQRRSAPGGCSDCPGRRSYALGAEVLQAILPDHDGPTEIVPVDTAEPDEGSTGGIDSHPDLGTPESGYDGYHAMALAVLLGHGDTEVISSLPATISPERLALAGLHDWTEDDFPKIEAWGLTAFGPDDLRETSSPLLTWLASTGATKVAIHFDVDVVDSHAVALGLGRVPGGLCRAQVHRLITDIADVADVVGLTIAEFIPRHVLAMQGILDGFPLIPGSAPGPDSVENS